MTDIHIGEVHTEIEITEGVGALGPSEVKKLVALVMAQLKAEQQRAQMCRQDDRLHDSSYMSDVRT
jgi:hypothetical protein